MSGVTGHAHGMGAAHNSVSSAPLYAAATPSRPTAADTSTETILAWACGLRRTARYSAPGMGKSLVNLASPVSNAGSSRRNIGVPMTIAGRSSVMLISCPRSGWPRRRALT